MAPRQTRKVVTALFCDVTGSTAETRTSSYAEISVEVARANDKATGRPRGPRDEPGVMVARITAAARASFAQNGWAGTTLRGVAREVGVDPALVHYYFSSKEELLDASTMPPPAWIESIRATNSVPARERGEAMVRNVIWGWSQPEIREVLSSILLTAAHEPRTREKLRAYVAANLLPAVAERLDDEERLLRASLIATQVVGLLLMRWLWEIEPLASLSDDDLVALVAPTLQRYLTGRLR
jgi:AcrR family transcriptional regulator